jgi:hypothetical protein
MDAARSGADYALECVKEMAACRCHFSGSGKPILPKSVGFGALPKSVGFGRMGAAALNPFAAAALAQAAATPPVVLSNTVASNVVNAAAAVSSGAAPSPSQAINIIKTLVPPVPFAQNLPTPTKSGNSYKGLSGYMPPRYGSFSRLGRLGVASEITDFQVGASTGAIIGSVVPGVGTAIGAAVGAIVGLVAGLFGSKKAVPKVSQADVVQAQTWMQQYVQVAGSVVGRNFSASAIQDMLTAMAILDPGFWGDSSSLQISIPAVQNWYGEEMTRLNDFFTAMSKVPIGSPVTMADDPSIPGHGKTNLSITFTFTNPGVNAPSYVLGPLFAQYFYVMCGIFVAAADCTGHLTAPLPQMHTDILDWFRAGKAGWDTPQPNVVTGTDASIAAPTSTTVVTPATATTAAQTVTTFTPPPVTAPPVAASLPTYSTPAANLVNLATNPSAGQPTPLDQPSTIMPVASGPVTAISPVSNVLGLSTPELLVLALLAGFLLLGRK